MTQMPAGHRVAGQAEQERQLDTTSRLRRPCPTLPICSLSSSEENSRVLMMPLTTASWRSNSTSGRFFFACDTGRSDCHKPLLLIGNKIWD